MLSYLARRGYHPGPLFLFEDGSPLSRSRLVSELRKALSSIRLNCDVYAGHSFRIGAATTAASRGLEDSTMKLLGRWRSDAYQSYIRLDSVMAQFSRTLSA